MFLIVGLGNYPNQYLHNRHNFGFMMLDALASYYQFCFTYSNQFNGLFSSLKIGCYRLLFLKPMTLMNCSGESVYNVKKFFHIEPSKILILHDDLELKFGKCRLCLGGSNHGHNGLRSITNCIQSNDYYRYQLGIGRPMQQISISSYVLSDFTTDELAQIIKLQKEFIEEEFTKIIKEMAN